MVGSLALEESMFYKKLSGEKWKSKPGILAGCSQPGRGESINDLQKLSKLKEGMPIDQLGLEDIMRDLNILYKNGTRVIYCLASNNRKPELIKYLWQTQFNDTIHITDIDDISIEIEDYTPPSIKQLEIITEDIFSRIEDGQKLVVHCVGGKGRTGTILTAVYMKLFKIYNAYIAIKYIRENYLTEAVETESQVKILKLYANIIEKNND